MMGHRSSSSSQIFMANQVEQCPYCLGNYPHQGPTGCRSIFWHPDDEHKPGCGCWECITDPRDEPDEPCECGCHLPGIEPTMIDPEPDALLYGEPTVPQPCCTCE